MNTETESHCIETSATVKLGIDVPARWCSVARQLDGAYQERKDNRGNNRTGQPLPLESFTQP